MLRLVRNALLVFVLIVIIVLVWNDLTDHQEDSYLPERVKLSALPEEIAGSLSVLEERANSRQKEMLKKGFRLNISSLTGEKEIDAETPLVLQSFYQGSNQLVQKVISMPESFVGLTARELASLTRDWEIKGLEPGRGLTLYREVNDLSPEDKKVMHLGIKGEKVAIYYGETGDNYLKQITDINVSDLPYSEQKALEEGIVVYSQEELLSLLEGLVGIIKD